MGGSIFAEISVYYFREQFFDLAGPILRRGMKKLHTQKKTSATVPWTKELHHMTFFEKGIIKEGLVSTNPASSHYIPPGHRIKHIRNTDDFFLLTTVLYCCLSDSLATSYRLSDSSESRSSEWKTSFHCSL